MKGSDLLDKLENLDPGLVAGAAEPPVPSARRRPEWGGLLAAAACIAAICLPLALTYLIHGVAPTIEYGPGSQRGSGTSHQVSSGDKGPEGGSGEGNSLRGANRGEPEGSPDSQAADPEPQVTVMGYGGACSWTRYTLDEGYTSAYDILPAEEYFKYNVQGLGAIPELWYGLSYDLEPFDSPRAESWVREFSELLSGGYTEPVICADLDQGRVTIKARYGVSFRDDGSDSLLTVDVCQRDPTDYAALGKVMARTNETAVVFPEDDSGGRRVVFAMGGLDSDRCLYTILPFTNIWCRIAAGATIPAEDMAAILQWLFSVPELMGQVNLLAGFNPEVYPYIPTPGANDFAAPMGGTGAGLEGPAGQSQNRLKVNFLEVTYSEGYEGRPLERYSIDRLDTYAGEDESMGDLYELTREGVEKEYARQKGAMDGARSADIYKRDQPMHYTFCFTWDDYCVTAVFSEELKADQLWGFLQQLAGREQPEGGTVTGK